MRLKYINWSADIFPGFYESILYNSDTLYNMNENADEDELKEGEYYDFQEPDGYKGFEKSVCEQSIDALFYSMDDAPEITGMKFIALHSPHYYNFETDKIEIEVDCDWQHILEYAQKTMRQDFDSYLRENFTSRDGFWSFVPNNVGEFFVKLDDDFEKLSQVVLEYFIINHLDRDLYQERLYEIATNTIWQYIEVYTKDGEPKNKEDDNGKSSIEPAQN